MPVYELVIEGRQGDNDMLNVLHYDDGGSGPPVWADVAAVIEGHLTDHITILCGPRVTWEGITAREDIVGGVSTFTAFPGGTLQGSNGSDDQADVITMMVKKLSNGLVRPTYGWFMQGGLTPEGINGQNEWEAAYQAGVLSYANDIRILNMAGAITLSMVIKASNPTAPNTQPYSPVNTFQIRAQPRTQRTRLAGSGS